MFLDTSFVGPSLDPVQLFLDIFVVPKVHHPVSPEIPGPGTQEV